MLSAGDWTPNQPNTVLFVLVDGDGNEVQGLGTVFTVQLSKGGAAFQAGLGTKAEVGLGWYRYIATAAEADTPGPVAITITGSGVVQQNLEYVVASRVVTSVLFTYTVTSTVGNAPIAGVHISIYKDGGGTQLVWTGLTDAFGVARDEFGNVPRVEPGTYYIWRYRVGYLFNDPDVETIS